MRKRTALLLTLLSTGAVQAQDDAPVRTLKAESVEIRAQRPLRDIGVQKSVLDTFALRENVTYSLAEVLSQSSSIFIKSYGRATLATASFRGTAPSHTNVTWNGMKINSPMLGMVDFSQIPSYFIDDLNLFHGASSVGVAGGGLGGAITLSTKPTDEKGFGLRYIQGISSFATFDEFLRLTYGSAKWQASTRVVYSSSDNDFKYTNYRKKNYTYNDQGEISGYTYPEERNKNGSFRDLHVLQELYHDTGNGNKWGLSAWYMNSRRGVPMLNVDYKDDNLSRNQQDEQTFRTALTWDRLAEQLKLSAKGGYTYTDLKYVYKGDPGSGELTEMIHSQSYVHTGFGQFNADWFLGEKWMVSGNLSAYQHLVKSVDRAVVGNAGQIAVIGYDKGRFELSGFAAVRYKPTERLGFSVNVREELYGQKGSSPIVAGFAEYLVSKRGNVVLKASVAQNYRYPTLNDLYFMPGGNPDLQPEKGFTYDGGVEFRLRNSWIDFRGEVTGYDSYIDNWILWLPTFKGFWSPVNVKKVHSYGLEIKGKLRMQLNSDWWVNLDGNYTISKAINRGDPMNWADDAIGKQLVYIPEYSAAVTGKLGWRSWTLTYQFNYYSERYTTSSNETQTKVGRLSPYYMNDLSLEKSFSFRWARLSLKAVVNNFFDEAYESVLSRPMPGRNYGFFIELNPRFGRSRK